MAKTTSKNTSAGGALSTAPALTATSQDYTFTATKSARCMAGEAGVTICEFSLRQQLFLMAFSLLGAHTPFGVGEHAHCGVRSTVRATADACQPAVDDGQNPLTARVDYQCLNVPHSLYVRK